MPIGQPAVLSAAIATSLAEPQAPVADERLAPYRQAAVVEGYLRLFHRVIEERRHPG